MDETTDMERKRRSLLTSQKLDLIQTLGRVSDEDVARHEAQIRMQARQRRALLASACMAVAVLFLMIALGTPKAVEARPTQDTTFAVYGQDSNVFWCSDSFCFQSRPECEARGWTCSEYVPTAGPPIVAMGCECPVAKAGSSGKLFINIICRGRNAGGDVDVQTFIAGDGTHPVISTGKLTLAESPAVTELRSRGAKMRWHSHLGHGTFLITASSGPYDKEELNITQADERLPGLNATVEILALDGPATVLASAPAKCSIE